MTELHSTYSLANFDAVSSVRSWKNRLNTKNRSLPPVTSKPVSCQRLPCPSAPAYQHFSIISVFGWWSLGGDTIDQKKIMYKWTNLHKKCILFKWPSCGAWQRHRRVVCVVVAEALFHSLPHLRRLTCRPWLASLAGAAACKRTWTAWPVDLSRIRSWLISFIGHSCKRDSYLECCSKPKVSESIESFDAFRVILLNSSSHCTKVGFAYLMALNLRVISSVMLSSRKSRDRKLTRELTELMRFFKSVRMSLEPKSVFIDTSINESSSSMCASLYEALNND